MTTNFDARLYPYVTLLSLRLTILKRVLFLDLMTNQSHGDCFGENNLSNSKAFVNLYNHTINHLFPPPISIILFYSIFLFFKNFFNLPNHSILFF